MFTLFDLIFTLFLIFFDLVIGTFDTQSGIGVISGLYLLAVFIPRLAVTVRRLHDTDKSGWVVLIGLIPLIGFIWILVFMVQDSQLGENQYGPDPKIETA
jgi:uncharacterized membrane protein YhaH (DUF805 family)